MVSCQLREGIPQVQQFPLAGATHNTEWLPEGGDWSCTKIGMDKIDKAKSFKIFPMAKILQSYPTRFEKSFSPHVIN